MAPLAVIAVIIVMAIFIPLAIMAHNTPEEF